MMMNCRLCLDSYEDTTKRCYINGMETLYLLLYQALAEWQEELMTLIINQLICYNCDFTDFSLISPTYTSDKTHGCWAVVAGVTDQKQRFQRQKRSSNGSGLSDYLQLIDYLMASHQIPKRCDQCGSFYLAHEEDDHRNMHIDPSKLAPKTNPNDLRKIELAKVIITEERTDESDIALRSLLPDEIPKPQEERKKMQAPDVEHQPQNASIFNPYGAGGNDAHNYNRVRDKLDLTSKLASTDLRKDQLNKLEIEKQVDIKPIKTVVPKKEIHKFQNSHYAGKETRDLGGCDKKEMPNGLNGGNGGDKVGSGSFIGTGVPIGGSGSGEGKVGEGNNLGYEVKADNTYLANTSKKSLVVVPISRKTGNPSEYKAVDTKANQQGEGNKKISNSYAQRQRDSESDRDLKDSKVKPYNQNGLGFGSQHHHHGNHVSNGDHLHHHECPSCHGFYCQHCGSTIPPEYRPFWDPEESPEMVEYYKKRVRECRDKEREIQKKMREGCGQCNTHKKQEQKPL